jgi:hypothetical protein
MPTEVSERDAAPRATAAGEAATADTPPTKPVCDPSLPVKLDSLRISPPDQQQQQRPTIFTSSDAQRTTAAAVASQRSPARPPPLSPSMSRVLGRRGSFSERPIDVVRMALVTQRNEMCSLVARCGRQGAAGFVQGSSILLHFGCMPLLFAHP